MRDFFGKNPEGLYICKACGITQRSYSNMRQHVESRHYSPGYSCQTCGETFQINQTCNKHQKKCGLWINHIDPSIKVWNFIAYQMFFQNRFISIYSAVSSKADKLVALAFHRQISQLVYLSDSFLWGYLVLFLCAFLLYNGIICETNFSNLLFRTQEVHSINKSWRIWGRSRIWGRFSLEKSQIWSVEELFAKSDLFCGQMPAMFKSI